MNTWHPKSRFIGPAAWRCLLAICALIAPSAAADTVLDHSDRGAFNVSNSASFSGNWKVTGGSYQVRAADAAVVGGPAGTSVDVTRAYFTFDLSNLIGSISGAELRIAAAANSYNSADLSETVEFFDVSTSTADLLAGNSASDASAIFADLGTGLSYGTLEMTASDNGTAVSATLNANAISALQAAVGMGTWAVGLDLASVNASSAIERVFRGSGANSPPTQLVLTGLIQQVPEPASGLLLGTFACGLALAASRRRTAAGTITKGRQS